MKIQFEDWSTQQDFSSRTSDLFKESILCYRSRAYKGALLFSFLSFQNIIMERILNAKIPPTALTYEKKWIEINSKLRDEDKSDGQVIESIIMQKPFDIFNLSEDTRNQYIYWKNRRNDCAHGKENKIDYSHIESFWLFIESNLEKFNVNGGVSHLIEKVKNHFDITRTPSDKNPSYLIKIIPEVMIPLELKDFLETTYENVISKKTFHYDDANVLTFYKELLNLKQEFLPYVLNYFKENKSLLINLLAIETSLIYQFKTDPVFIRMVWKTELKNSFSHYRIVVSLLRYKLIPKDQFEEFVIAITENNSDTFFVDISAENQVEFNVLKESIFLKTVGDIAFHSDFPKINSFDWARENKNLLCHYLRIYNFNEDVVRALYSTFSKPNYPWQFGKTLVELFEQEPELFEYYTMIADLHSIEIPSYFQKRLGI
ncbi:hypothetical protein [Paenisporosarcina antarctica]|uniref:Uncharacterized protein n=1 Tax=Paenisporosarcina antarctica TaxID=417367 RepID=A0A4P7A3S0_9BACL|nr:hypothetical protein [Paenisporosarcina antarctica]QBP43169.1 hypothetical protein E2636_18595 [Paenisporosarcina antarctica]